MPLKNLPDSAANDMRVNEKSSMLDRSYSTIEKFLVRGTSAYPAVILWFDDGAEPYAGALFTRLDGMGIEVTHAPASIGVQGVYGVKQKYVVNRKIVGVVSSLENLDEEQYKKIVDFGQKCKSPGVLIMGLFPELKFKSQNGNMPQQLELNTPSK